MDWSVLREPGFGLLLVGEFDVFFVVSLGGLRVVSFLRSVFLGFFGSERLMGESLLSSAANRKLQDMHLQKFVVEKLY